MNIYIFTKKESAIKNYFGKDARFVSISELSGHNYTQDDLCYIDVSGLNDADLKKVYIQIKKIFKDSFWGIIDPKGSVKDPAALFFQGASDYLGQSFFKNSKKFDQKRVKEVIGWKMALVSRFAGKQDAKSANGSENAGIFKTGIKLPAENSFSGWKKMQTGKVMPFYLLYCSIQGKIPLESRLDEKTISQIYQKFYMVMNNHFKDADGLFWMNSGKDCIFLFPPKAKCANNLIKACIRMIVSAPLLVLESIGISIPANFIFALHYGSVSYKPPGKTGTVVSDAVNFIFHLGTKKSAPGRLTVSGEIPEKTIPLSLQDCFVKTGEFEGRKIWHTKKFCYAKK